MAKNLRKHGIHFFRYVYCNDMVPIVPFVGVFKHFGTCVYYNSKYQPSIVDEEPYKNYFSIGGSIAMRINAVYEMIRSFLMCNEYGPDYREGWVLLGMRILGLLIPGIPAHCAQDYVNSTRLGKLSHVFFHHFHHK
ncbi:triacylglycerol lipase OBL1-like [Hibiscus syriacus]|uniref:triacylglycerol lipase OBL1-like n=1 Tax=Hibiscus syriacus TaxID=106335 RepID=UPI001923FA17|nr:triacylglycerol lipase OBL1-like [Hibiscus syriacus]